MKDFRFSYKFKMACKEDVLRLCPNIKKKSVPACLVCFSQRFEPTCGSSRPDFNHVPHRLLAGWTWSFA